MIGHFMNSNETACVTLDIWPIWTHATFQSRYQFATMPAIATNKLLWVFLLLKLFMFHFTKVKPVLCKD